MRVIGVVCLDDHAVVREGIEAIITGVTDIELIASFAEPPKLFDFLRHNKTDIILLDIKLGEHSGIDIAQRLHKEYPEIKVIMLTAMDDEQSVSLSLKAGVYGFLTKDANQSEFLKAISEVYLGRKYFSTGISQTIYDGYAQHLQKTNSPTDLLSEREIEIIRLITNGLQQKDIADILFISPRTVETHKKNIMEKLSLKSTADLIKFAIKQGIIVL